MHLEKGIKWGVSILVFVILVVWLNPLAILQNLSLITWPLFLISLGGVFATLLLNSLTQAWLLNEVKRLGYKKILLHYMKSWTTEFVLPGKLGVFSLAYFLRDDGVELGTSLATIILARIFISIAAIFLALIGISRFLQIEGLFASIMALLVALLLVMGLLFTQDGRNFIKERMLRGHASHFQGFGSAIQKILGNPIRVAGLILLISLQVLLAGLVSYLSFWISGYYVDFLTMLSVLALVQIVIQIPISINGFGLREGTMVLLLAQVGIPGDVTLVLSTFNIGVAYAVAGILSWNLATDLAEKSLSFSHKEK